MAKEKEAEVLTTENAPEPKEEKVKEPAPKKEEPKKAEPVKKEPEPMVAVEASHNAKLKAKAEDVKELANAVKHLAGLALTADGFETFKQSCPLLFTDD